MIAGIVAAYRRHPRVLLGTALAVLLPLQVPRYFLIAVGLGLVAIGLTVLGHLALVPLLRRRPELEVPPIGVGAAALGLVAIIGLESVSGLAVEAVVGRSTFGIMFGGFVPSVLLAPAWALVAIGALQRRRTATTP